MNNIDHFDECVELAWARFRSQMARSIGELPGGDVVELRADTALTPFAGMRIERRPGLGVHASVLAPPEECGQAAPARCHTPVTTGDPDAVASWVVRVLRERWDVVEPAFVQVGPRPGVAGAQWFDELRVRVGDALAQVLGRPASIDADGDFVLVLDSQVIFVIVDRTVPAVRLWTPLLHRITDRIGAAHWVDRHHRGVGVHAMVVEDRLVGTGEIPAAPFDPAVLEERIDVMRRLMPAVARRVATDFGGVHYTEDDRRPGSPDTSLFDDWY
ncbi:hypothetical protein ACFWDA_22945 [Rhodococcus zopfii]|uniref:TY-Chap central domain-containing protein n=1 Tax=Rhodococcus zopfii TaxID=43772 RepID=A0ABU3WRI0_9NOCA|nr:hypothetical protein [Rhodococcus zopfii]MDV2476538.1 hypothetical protein [Rhodococcus zopfii]